MASMEKIEGNQRIFYLSRHPLYGVYSSNGFRTGNSRHLQEMLQLIHELESGMARLKLMEANIEVTHPMP